jgi:hypothetical protein
MWGTLSSASAGRALGKRVQPQSFRRAGAGDDGHSIDAGSPARRSNGLTDALCDLVYEDCHRESLVVQCLQCRLPFDLALSDEAAHAGRLFS